MKYIFIVGLPRTGTKLMKNVLQRSTNVRCRISAETWFFGDLFRSGIRRKIRHFGDLKDDSNVRKLVDYMYSGRFGRTFWTILSKNRLSNKSWMENEILNSDRTERAIYRIILMSSAIDGSDPDVEQDWVLGDKTPGNLYYVPEILDWFPDAKIVHTFRDPRAILASEWKRLLSSSDGWFGERCLKGLYSLVIVLYVSFTWLYAAKLHRRYSKEYPNNYVLSKYEDFVSNPETSVREVCSSLGLEFSDSMLETALQGSSYTAEKTPGFDNSAIDRWRQHLKPWMRSWITLLGRRQLKDFGYRP